MSGEAIYLQLPPEAKLPAIGNVPSRVVVVVEEEVSSEWQAQVSEWIVRFGCLYMLAWGSECSSWDDSVDRANLQEFDYGLVPDIAAVMTTWHADQPLGDVFRFAKTCAVHPVVDLGRTIIVHISREFRGNEFLDAFARA